MDCSAHEGYDDDDDHDDDNNNYNDAMMMMLIMIMIRCFVWALKYGSDHIYLTRMLRVARRM